MAITEENFAPSREDDLSQRLGQIETYRDSFLEDEAKSDVWNAAVTEWFAAFSATHPDARDYQLTQVLIGGTPDATKPIDTDSEEIYNAALEVVKKVRAA